MSLLASVSSVKWVASTYLTKLYGGLNEELDLKCPSGLARGRPSPPSRPRVAEQMEQ